MKNTLVDLQNHLFELLETINDQDLKGDDLDQEIKRSLAANELAKTMVQNGALMVKAADTLYGLHVSDDLPLIPKSPADKPFIVTGKKQNVLEIPKGKK